MSSEGREEKRGKKRSRSADSSRHSSPNRPSPKRRKISTQHKHPHCTQHSKCNIGTMPSPQHHHEHAHTFSSSISPPTDSGNLHRDVIKNKNKNNKNKSEAQSPENSTNRTTMPNASSHCDDDNNNDKDNNNNNPSTNHLASDRDDAATDIEMNDVEQPSTNEKQRENSLLSAATPPASQSQPQSPSQTTSVSMNDSSIIRRIQDDDVFFDHLSIYTDRRCLLHAIPDDTIIHEFNERPQRLQALLDMVEEEKWNRHCRFIPALDSVPTTTDIEGYHKSGYLADLKTSCSKIYEANWSVAQGSDTYVVKHTLDAALVSAGLVMQATKYVFSFFDDTEEMQIEHVQTDDAAVSANGDNDRKIDADDPVDDEDNAKLTDCSKQMDVDDEEVDVAANMNGHNSNENKIDADAHKMEHDGDDRDANEQHETVANGDSAVKHESDSNGNVEENTKKKQRVKKYAVVLNRPPGHHCDGNKYSGYCYINSTAVAIEKHLNVDTKVLVLDIDVHHGDGTQKIFYAEPTVLTVSFHQYDGQFFPSSGTRTEYGPSRRHKAYGTNINVPLEKQASDFDVLYALRKFVWDIVEKFKPDIAFYAVGTDGVANDKANNSTIFTPNLYGQIAYELTKYTNLIVVTTEGGYTTRFLADGLSCVLHGLTGNIDTNFYPEEIKEADILPATVHNVAATRSDLRKVYNFEREAGEFERIFNGANMKTNSADSSFEINWKEYDSDGDFNDAALMDEDDDDGDEDFVSNAKEEKKKKKKKEKKSKEKDKDKKKGKAKEEKSEKKKNKEKDKDKDRERQKDKDKERKKKKKKKKQKDKDKGKEKKEADNNETAENRQTAIDLTDNDNNTNNNSKESNKKKDKKSKKKKKKDKDKKSRKRNKDKQEREKSPNPQQPENRNGVNHNKAQDLLDKLNSTDDNSKHIVSLTAPKKSKLPVPNPGAESAGIAVIDLIEDSPAAIDSDTANLINDALNEHEHEHEDKNGKNGTRSSSKKKKKKKKKDKDKDKDGEKSKGSKKKKKRKKRKEEKNSSRKHTEETENVSGINNYSRMFTLSGILSGQEWE